MSRLLPVLLMLLALSPFPGRAETPDPRERDHAQLRALLGSATEAVNRGDEQALGRLLAPGFVITFADQTRVTGPAALKEYLHRLLRAGDAPLKAILLQPVADAPTQFIGADTGVAFGSSTDTFTLADGSEMTLDSLWTATVVRDAGEWKIRAFHAGVDMLDNPIMDTAGQLGWFMGGGGLLAGLAGGWLLGRRRGG